MSDTQLPAIEYEPPYSLAFVAHLDSGCYAEDVTTGLLTRVRVDPGGRRMLDALALVRLELDFLRQ